MADAHTLPAKEAGTHRVPLAMRPAFEHGSTVGWDEQRESQLIAYRHGWVSLSLNPAYESTSAFIIVTLAACLDSPSPGVGEGGRRGRSILHEEGAVPRSLVFMVALTHGGVAPFTVMAVSGRRLKRRAKAVRLHHLLGRLNHRLARAA